MTGRTWIQCCQLRQSRSRSHDDRGDRKSRERDHDRDHGRAGFSKREPFATMVAPQGASATIGATMVRADARFTRNSSHRLVIDQIPVT